MKNCPRCKNSEINTEDNYCKICGLDLKEATAVTAAPKVTIQDRGPTVHGKLE